MKQKSLKINAILNFIRSFVGLIFPLITFPYSSRVLLPEGIGRVNFAQSIVSDIHVKTIHCDSISIHYSIIIATSTDLFQFQQEVIQKLTPLVAYSSLKEDGVYEK